MIHRLNAKRHQAGPPSGSSSTSFRVVWSLELLGWILFTLLAIAMRVDWHLAYAELPLYLSPAVDEALHWQWAQDLAQGQGSPEIPYFRAPLYPWWLGALRSLGLGLGALRWAGSLLGMAALALTVWLVMRLEGRRAALVALALAGSCATWIHYEPQLLLEHLVLFWLLLATAMLAKSEGREAGWPELGFGLGLGLAAITRPNAVLLAPLALGILWRRQTGLRGWWPRALWWSAGWLPALALVASINQWPGSGVLVASQGGVNLWIGSHGGADGWSATLPEVGSAWERADATGLAQRELGHRPSPAEESAFYTRRAVTWAASHPGELAGQLIWKGALLLAPQEMGNNTSPQRLAAQRGWMASLLPWSWWLLLMPGGIGLALGFPRQARLRRWLWGALLLYGASFLPFFIAGRFRIPLLGLLALPAATWLADLLAQRRVRDSRGERPAAWRLALISCLALASAVSAGWVAQRFTTGHERHQQGWQAFQLGNAWQRLGQVDSARAQFELALRAAPELKEVRLSLGLLALPADPALAQRCFEDELKVDGRSAKAWNNLGTLWLGQKQARRAVEAFNQALVLRPDLSDAQWNLGLAWATIGLDAVQAGDGALAHQALSEVQATPYRGRGLQRLVQLLAASSQRPVN